MQQRRRTGVVWVLVCAGYVLACAADESLPPVDDERRSTAQRGTAQTEPEAEVHRPEQARSTTEQTLKAQGGIVMNPQVAARLRGSLRQRLARSVDDLPRHTLPGAGDAVDVRGRFQHAVVQIRDADGQVHTKCLEDHAQLEQAFGAEAHP